MQERNLHTDIWYDHYDTPKPLSTPSSHIPIRFSEIDPQVPEENLYKEAIDSLWGVRRLRNIYQLSNLRFVGNDPQNVRDIGLFHTRYDHSLQAASISERSLRQNNAPSQMITLGIIAGLTHDIGTPPGGDATKKIDPENLHEEDHWREMVQDDISQGFLERHHINEDELDAIIHNKGLLGKVLDVADKVAYVTEDAYQIGGYHTDNHRITPASATLQERDMFQSFHESQNVGNIVNYIRIDFDNEDVYFTNPELLISLLENRAHLSRNIYFHPYNLAQDMFFTDLIRPFYSSRDDKKDYTLTPMHLRQMNDADLVDAINTYWGSHNLFRGLRSMMDNFHPVTQSFQTKDQAEHAFSELQKDPSITVMGIEKTPPINAGLSWKVSEGTSTKGKPYVRTIEEAYPYSATKIQRIIDDIPPFYVAFHQKGNEKFDDLVERVYQQKNEF